MENNELYDQSMAREILESDTILFTPFEEDGLLLWENTETSVDNLLELIDEVDEPAKEQEPAKKAPKEDTPSEKEPTGKAGPDPEEPDEEPTIVDAPERKKVTPWSVVWKITIFVARMALGVALAIGILVLGLLGYLTVTEYNPAYAETADRGSVNRSETITSRSLSILTFNTGYGGLNADADYYLDGGKGVLPESADVVEDNLAGIEGILSLCDADFIFLQEVDMESDRSFATKQWLRYEYDLEDYESWFALNHSCDYVPYPKGSHIGKVRSGLATYSKYGVASATRFSQPNGYDWPARATNMKRCLLVTRINIDDSEQQLVLINVHMGDYEDEELRSQQLQQLLELMEAEYAKGNFVIAGGDFNQTFPGCSAYVGNDPELWEPKQLEQAPSGFHYAYDDSNPTCRLLNQPYDPDSGATQFYVVDGFLVSTNVTVNRVETQDYEFIYSDHNPVLLNFTLNFYDQENQNTTEE